ncbi:hypothetical protein KKP04_01495 [Rhodomicrobium sp. Az07]|uniref:hypothetical protein n=1 Tax=Rhodomicrobium sp. Az07 TaxID=2839034 RepID=UPI001BE66551|nr:hypothetical protein [Rhodomicrobium sp. Az07]MBT3069544.1 hypothetical protein [Rhodomicrobium sp. Az07]
MDVLICGHSSAALSRNGFKFRLATKKQMTRRYGASPMLSPASSMSANDASMQRMAHFIHTALTRSSNGFCFAGRLGVPLSIMANHFRTDLACIQRSDWAPMDKNKGDFVGSLDKIALMRKL